MRSLDQALQTLLSQTQPITDMQSVMLTDSAGRILAADITSPIDVPAYDNSQMDGYVGMAVEMNNALEPMTVSQRIPAGHPGVSLQPCTVARIFTGAPIPQGADAVIMQEQVLIGADGRVKFTEPAVSGQNIRLRAGDIKSGQTILNKGRRLSAADAGLCASVGLQQLRVMRPLRVAVFSSGDELRQPGESLGFGQLFDSNRPMIISMAKRLGCDILDMGCLPDSLAVTKEKLQHAAEQCDAMLTCGGVSVGEEDHIKSAIGELGSLNLWKISVKPGKPFAFGRVGACVFMGMPGNPVAAWVTFALLVRPTILKMSGASMSAQTFKSFHVPAGFDWPKPDARQEFLRGWMDEQGRAQIHARQNSSVLSSVTECDGLVEIPASTKVCAGQMVRFIPYTELL